MLKKEDRWDVTPKEYAVSRGKSERAAQQLFSDWFDAGEWFIRREGAKTEAFPDGKPLRMNRAHFEELSRPKREEVARA